MIEKTVKIKTRQLLSEKVDFALLRLPGSKPLLLTGEALTNFSVSNFILSEDQNKDYIPAPTPINIYRQQLRTLIDRLKNRESAKTVLSRIISPAEGNFDWVNIAEDLWDYFPETFGYLFYLSSVGAWLGATPEILLTVDNKRNFITHSLAGTLPVENEWDEKNIIEQKIVSEYLEQIFKINGINFSKSPVESLEFGKIKHLCTKFSGNLPKNTSIDTVLRLLAPTPAIAGFPKKDALKDIYDLEQHNRRCYGGYMTLELEGNVYSFVVIRCVHFNPVSGKAALYVGGGITASSVPEVEEIETAKKAEVLLNFIEKHRLN